MSRPALASKLRKDMVAPASNRGLGKACSLKPWAAKAHDARSLRPHRDRQEHFRSRLAYFQRDSVSPRARAAPLPTPLMCSTIGFGDQSYALKPRHSFAKVRPINPLSKVDRQTSL